MLNTFFSLRIALKRHGWWLFAACAAVFSLQFIAVSWLVLGDGGYPWHGSRLGVFAIVLTLSIALGLVLLTWLHRSIMLPASSIVDDMEQLLDRARLMQTAMQPALELLGDGIERQGRMVDSLRQRVEAAHMSQVLGEENSSNDSERRHAFFVSTLGNLRADMASRRDVTRTLASATESIGLRLCELEDAVARVRSMLSETPSPKDYKSKKVQVPQPKHKSDYPFPEFDSELAHKPASQPISMAKRDIFWLDEPTKPLMSEFMFSDDQTKRRFKMP